MVMSAYMLVVVCGERPVGDSNCVLLGSRTHPLSRCANVWTHLPRLFQVLEAVSRECESTSFSLSWGR